MRVFISITTDSGLSILNLSIVACKNSVSCSKCSGNSSISIIPFFFNWGNINSTSTVANAQRQVRLIDIEIARLIFDHTLPFRRVSLPKILYSNITTGMFNIIAIKKPKKRGVMTLKIFDITDKDLSKLITTPSSNIEAMAIASHFR